MQPGDCFTIEVGALSIFEDAVLSLLFQPAIVQGTEPLGWTFPDGWTVSTEASSLKYLPCWAVLNFESYRTALVQHKRNTWS